MFARARNFLASLHRDDRGNIGTLLLLTVFVLVALLVLIWNTTEVATRREFLQNTADTSAHATATWISRCTNLETAQNIVIGQDASMETIWRAAPPTDYTIRTELEAELALIQGMLNGDSAYSKLIQRLQTDLNKIETEYPKATAALTSVQNNASDDSSDPTVQQQYTDSVTQAGQALTWVQNTYVGGAAATYPGQPGPPGGPGKGLQQLVAEWQQLPGETQFLQTIESYVQQELVVLAQFEACITPAMAIIGQAVPVTVWSDGTATQVAQNAHAQVAPHEAEVFANEQTIANGLTQTVAQQLTQQADFYKVQLTLATTGRGAQAQGPAQVLAPVVPASSIPSVDGIDPINVEGVIYTGPVPQLVASAAMLAQYPGLATYQMNCNIDGGWGHSYGTPMKRYLDGRVWNDQQGLNVYMQQIDQLRQQLAQQLQAMGWVPPPKALPLSIPVQQADAQGQHNAHVLPSLKPDAGASGALQTAVKQYDKASGQYIGAVIQLYGDLAALSQYFARFTNTFAQATWHANVHAQRMQVLYDLGAAKQFMVLATYGLYQIPDWAKPGMQTSVENAFNNPSVQDSIVQLNLNAVRNLILGPMMSQDPDGIGSGYSNPSQANQAEWNFYYPLATQLATAILNATVPEVGPLIAAQWVQHPWPYEITPPTTTVPPAQGMTTPDRQTYFTVIAAAQPTINTAPNLFLKTLMGNPATPNLLAHTQAESFNWMEFNGAYGGSERFDQVAWDHDVGFVNSPIPWRLSTIGGWNWNPRLAVADALAPAIANNPEMETYFQQSGVSGDDPASIQTLTLH